jgi:hypothetical protein
MAYCKTLFMQVSLSETGKALNEKTENYVKSS